MRRGELYTGFWWGNQKERGHMELSGVDGRIILRWIFRKWDLGVWTWVDLAVNMDTWRARANAIINFRVP